jgi:cytochrome c5
MPAPYRLVAAVLLLAAVSCGGGAVPHPTEAHLARARARWPDATAASLERGRELYVARCSGCHPLHPPDTQPAARWAAVLDQMAPRAKLSADERELVLRYLTATSR